MTETAPFKMRKPCPCGGADGEIREKGAQDCVYCCRCGKWQYNAPRVETGKAVRSVTTTHNGISPKQRARILVVRANGRCEVCGAAGKDFKPLHVAHIISVKAGLEMGLTEVDLNTDENLCSMCDECNMGLGREPVPLRLAVRILMARIRFLNEKRRAG